MLLLGHSNALVLQVAGLHYFGSKDSFRLSNKDETEVYCFVPCLFCTTR